ncbi:MAG: hypothetical protein JW800_04505 [Candidatus Omnitrophica bacterium]|nr:hypothetical protein [Candidatus Omnitrophota bacterium]
MYSGINYGGWGLLLLAMGVGYLICLKAAKENTKLFQYAGYVIGVVMITLSFVLSLFNIGDTVASIKMTVRRARRTTLRSSRNATPQQKRDTTIPQPATDLDTKLGLPRKAIGISGERTEPNTER